MIYTRIVHTYIIYTTSRQEHRRFIIGKNGKKNENRSEQQ